MTGAYKPGAPITIETEPSRPARGDCPSVSGTYRNIAAKTKLPTEALGCTTTYEIFQRAVELFPKRKFVGWRETNPDGTPTEYKWLTYAESAERVTAVAASLAAQGIGPGGRVGVYAINSAENMLCLRALEALSAVAVPMYDTLGADAIAYIMVHAELAHVVVGREKLVALSEVAKGPLANLSHVTVIGASAGELGAGTSEGGTSGADTGKEAGALARAASLIRAKGAEVAPFEGLVTRGRELVAAGSFAPSPPTAETTACIMYTSGTTGVPKGVRHVHRSIVSAVKGAIDLVEQARLAVTERDCIISYLPLAHIFDRVIEELAVALGAHIGYWRGTIPQLLEDVKALAPTLFMAVPRVLERICDGVRRKVAAGPLARRAIFRAALAYKSTMLRAGLPRALASVGPDALVFNKVREAMGGNVRFVLSGGAPLAPHVEDFVSAAMGPLLQGYGLTETGAANFATLPEHRFSHTVGAPLSGTEFRLESVPELGYEARPDPSTGTLPRGEVCIRGPMILAEYFKDPEQTAASFDADGFFHTGDIGEITRHGALRVFDRKKNIFKLAQGEYVAVEFLEGVLCGRTEALEQLWLHGDSTKSALVAVGVPSQDFLARYSDASGRGLAGLADDAHARQVVLGEIKETAKVARLHGFEVPKALRLEAEAWTPESGLLTPSLKLKRPQLAVLYRDRIDEMYAELEAKA